MKFSELKGRAVVSVGEAKKLGDVDDLLVDLVSQKIGGVKVKEGLFGHAHTVPVGEVKNIGPDAVTVLAQAIEQSDSGQEGAIPPEAGPSPTTPALTEITQIFGHKVVTDAGEVLGEVHDVSFDPVSMVLTGFEVKEGGIFGKTKEIPTSAEVHFGDKLVTVPAQPSPHAE